jgi:DNA-binding beta-propeller fold protein YncE
MEGLGPGSEIAGCRLEKSIGRGGMGVVWRARQIDLDRDVAVKLIAPDRIGDERAERRFIAEARAAAAVEHPNILPVYAAGIAGDRAYLVSRYIAGDDLGAVVRLVGAMTPARAAEIAASLSEALDAIHLAGFVHRDVKPANVLIDSDGHVYLSDFGLAKHVVAQTGPTVSGHWVGTLDFVAPEQIRGEPVDARADVYALGGVLHFMLTAAVPFQRDGDEAKLWAHLASKPPRPTDVRPDLPREFDAVLQRAMAKGPADRYRSAGDLGQAALAAASGGVPAAPERDVARGSAASGMAPTPPWLAGAAADTRTATGPGAAPRRRRRRMAGLAALAVFLIAAVAGILLATDGGDAPRVAATPTTTAAAGTPTATTSAATSTATTPAAAQAAGPHVDGVVRRIGFRPRGVAVAGGSAWVISAHGVEMTRIDAATLERLPGLRVGRGATSISAYRGQIWVTNQPAHQLMRIDAERGELTMSELVHKGPELVVAGPSGIYVTGHEYDGTADELYWYDANGSLLRTVQLDSDADALALGAGFVWVALRSGARVLRLRQNLDGYGRAYLTGYAGSMQYGAGRLWATVPDHNSVARIDPVTRLSPEHTVGSRPEGIALAGGKVFVASRNADAVVVLDRRTGRRVGKPIRVRSNPLEVAAGQGYVWVTDVGNSTLTRIAY